MKYLYIYMDSPWFPRRRLLEAQQEEKTELLSPSLSTILERSNNLRFHEHYRMSKTNFIHIVNVLHPLCNELTRLDFIYGLLVYISFIGHKMTYRCLREFYQISLTTLYDKISFYSEFLSTVSSTFIILPEINELEHLSNGFKG